MTAPSAERLAATARAAGPVKVAYLVNQYPKVSHTFVRREILALEDAGVEVTRISVRATRDHLPDEADHREKARTLVLLDAGLARLVAAALVAAVTMPRRFLTALWKTTRMGLRSERGILRHLVYLCEACLLRRWLTLARVHHLHAHFGTNAAMVALLCRVLGGPPYSFTVHGPEEFDKADSLALTEKIAGARFVSTVCNFGRSQVLRRCPLHTWQKVHVVRCGVDAGYLDASPPPIPDDPRLVCVARLSEQKGLFLLLDAAARLHAQGVAFDLLLVGDGEMRGKIEARIAEAGLHERVHITGWQDAAAVQAYLARSRALVLPSFAEGLPVVLMEAMSMGRPVISTYVAGIPELVVDGANGWLVPAGAVDELAEAMRHALQVDRSTLESMGRLGRQKVRTLHDVRRNIVALKALFQRGEVG
jgi:glycosyltransferase involved in cell wall biosynthesis